MLIADFDISLIRFINSLIERKYVATAKCIAILGQQS